MATDVTLETTSAGNGERRLPRRPEYAGSLEVWKPPTDDLFGQFDLRIEDPEGKDPDNIIKSIHDVRIVCDLWLFGDIWKCVCGYFTCEVCFKPLKGATETLVFDLRERFVGCEHVEDGRVHLRMTRDVPGKQLVGDDDKSTIWDVIASLDFENECGKRGTITGFDRTEVRVFPHHG